MAIITAFVNNRNQTKRFILYVMTHYYYLIAAGRVIDDTTKYYKIAVGTSKQANRDYLTILALASEKNWYFEIVSPKSTEFVTKIAESVAGSQVTLPLLSLHFQKMSARDFVRAQKQHISVPLTSNSCRNLNDFMLKMNLNLSPARRNNV